jgi:hypothetical protein
VVKINEKNRQAHPFFAMYNNKTTLVWFLTEQKHTSDGLWPGNHETAGRGGFQARDHHIVQRREEGKFSLPQLNFGE